MEEDQDNTESAISEELSRFSSPTQSQSSSCTSISNPFYDGPTRPVENENMTDCGPQLNRFSQTGQQSRRRSDSRNPHVSISATRQSRSGSSSLVNAETLLSSSSKEPTKKDLHAESKIFVLWDIGHCFTCHGFLQILQIGMSIATLVILVSAGSKEGGLYNLPLSWHFRIMIFVLVLSILLTLSLFIGYVTSLIFIFGFDWTFFDFIVYSLFAFLYLVGSSLVASAFDFYEKMGSDVSKDTIDQLVISVILGYICMVLYGMTGFISFRKWKFQYRLYHRRKLIEEDEIDL